MEIENLKKPLHISPSDFLAGAMDYQRLMTYYQCALMETETKFKVLNEQLSIGREANPIESIKTRLKKPVSIAEKMTRRGLPLTVDAIEENLTDVAGVRVICTFRDDVYSLANSLLQQDDVRLLKVKDYISNPKDNGYRSLHLIVEIPIYLLNERREVKVEIQMRTIAMDFWASLEHKIRYKKNIEKLDGYEEISRRLKLCADQSAALDEMMTETHLMICKMTGEDVQEDWEAQL